MLDTILSIENGAMERWRKGDPWGFAEINADDICYVDQTLTKPIRGIAAYLEYIRPIAGQVHYQGSEFLDPRVVAVGDAAVLTYNYLSTTYHPDGIIAGQWPWNVTSVYFQRDGAWKVAHAHFSYCPHQLSDVVDVPVPVPAQPAPYSGVLGEVMALEAGAMERWRKGDPWGFIEISAPDVTYFDTGTPRRINGREALSEEYARREGKIFYDVMDFIDPRVQVCGDMAVLFYRFFSTTLQPDGAVARRTPWNCTEVFTRLDGQWRIIHTHWSLIGGQLRP